VALAEVWTAFTMVVGKISMVTNSVHMVSVRNSLYCLTCFFTDEKKSRGVTRSCEMIGFDELVLLVITN
jgi:hypothetical protein